METDTATSALAKAAADTLLDEKNALLQSLAAEHQQYRSDSESALKESSAALAAHAAGEPEPFCAGLPITRPRARLRLLMSPHVSSCLLESPITSCLTALPAAIRVFARQTWRGLRRRWPTKRPRSQ